MYNTDITTRQGQHRPLKVVVAVQHKLLTTDQQTRNRSSQGCVIVDSSIVLYKILSKVSLLILFFYISFVDWGLLCRLYCTTRAFVALLSWRLSGRGRYLYCVFFYIKLVYNQETKKELIKLIWNCWNTKLVLYTTNK